MMARLMVVENSTCCSASIRPGPHSTARPGPARSSRCCCSSFSPWLREPSRASSSDRPEPHPPPRPTRASHRSRTPRQPTALPAFIDRNEAREPWEQRSEMEEYTVILERPMGLTLVPDPSSGQFTVQSIAEGSAAAACKRIQVGDIVRSCSAVFREDVGWGEGSKVWRQVDLRRLRWTLDTGIEQVKLVLQQRVQARASTAHPAWYQRGEGGRASTAAPEPVQSASRLPLRGVVQWGLRSFSLGSRPEGRAEAEGDGQGGGARPVAGRSLSVGFHQRVEEPSPAAPQHSPRRPGESRQARLQQLRTELAQASSQAELDLAKLSRNGSSASTSTGTSTSSSSSHGRRGDSGTAAAAAGNGSGTAPAKKVLPFLPWMLVTTTRMDTRDLTSLASARGLSTLLELTLTGSSKGGHLAVKGAENGLHETSVNVSYLVASDGSDDGPGTSGGADHQGGSSGSSSSKAPVNGTQAATSRVMAGSGGAGARELEVRLLLHAAACIQRLSIRRLGSFSHTSSKERCALLLHCAPEVWPGIGNLLAGWLHWYRDMPLNEAILTTELALGCIVQQALLEEATRQLLRQAEERRSQVVLSWRHGALMVSVAGDIVGGWHKSVAMAQCSSSHGCKGSTSRGHFFLPVTGLKPGVYLHKFIVDGTWAVDPFAPKAIDNYGNLNNAFKVHAWPPPLTSKEKLRLARCQAAHLALESKMMGF